MKSIFSLFVVLFASAFVLLGGACATHGPEINVDDDAKVHLRAGNLPEVNLTSSILFHILVAELSAQEGDFDQAAQIFTEMARTTMDPRLAQRGFQAAMASRNMGLAYQAARTWANLDPDDPDAVASSLALAATSGNTSGLANALSKRIKGAENKEQAVMHASAIISKMPDKKLALEILDKVLDKKLLNMAISRLALADAAWAADDAKRAYSEAGKALRLEKNSEAAAQRVLEYGLRVSPNEAIRRAEDWISNNPDSRKMQMLFINRLVGRSEYSLALSYISQLRKKSPEDFDLLFGEAEIRAQAGQYERAKSLINEYINVQTQRRESLDDSVTSAQSDVSDARMLLVRIAEEEGDLGEAVRQIDLIDEPSVQFESQIMKAIIQGRMGELDMARDTIESLTMANDEQRATAAITLASIYREAGFTETAVDLLVKADKEIPDNPNIKYDLGMMYILQGKYEPFEALMLKVMELDPENANPYNSLGYTLTDQNRRLDEAGKLLEHALELDPDNPYILDSVGWYFYRVNDLEAALNYLRQAYSQMPDTEVAAHLGEVLWRSNKKDEARRIWAEGYKRDSENETLVKTLKRFNVQLPDS